MPPRAASAHRDVHRSLATMWIALLVCVAYYAGCQLGVQLRIPPTTPSVLWPPNAILTSALLLTPRRQWPLVLLAALPAHLIVELQTDWPLSLILALFVTNVFEATIAAGGVRLLTDGPPRFDTLRGLLAFFMAAVIAAPLLSSFGDAGAVAWLHGESYWHVWRNRLFSNMLAELVIVPAIVGTVTRRVFYPFTLSARTVEAILLVAGLILTGVTELTSAFEPTSALNAISGRAPLVVQLPFLLWAAARFGPTGSALTLLTTTVLSAWAVVHGHGPFASAAPGTSVTALTLSLIVVAAAFMSLATLIEERRRSQQALSSRLHFEELLGKLASAFAQLPSDRMDGAFDTWLPRLAEFLDMNAVALLTAIDTGPNMRATHWWMKRAKGLPRPPADTPAFPWAITRLARHESVVVGNLDDLPPEAAEDRASLEGLGLRSGLAIPLTNGHRLLGALAAGSVHDLAGTEEESASLRLVGEIMANVLERKRTEDQLRRSELMKSAILSSLSTGVVVVNRYGRVLARNENWTESARELGGAPVEEGGNLIAQFTAADAQGNPHAAEVASAISAVLDGTRTQSVVEQVSGEGEQRRWWSIIVVPLHHGQGGAVITQTDITPLRRAELEAQVSRQELAHVSRVATIGELTASLAHQLNQPLAAIRTNAQAALRMLDGSVPDVAEVRAILDDIVDDDSRARDVIQGLRDLLRKGQLQVTATDLTAAIRQVAGLFRTESIVHNVRMSVEFEREPVFVLADRVQIEQVVLNLLQNAIEATADETTRPPTVQLSCRTVDGVAVVRVSDSGSGLPAGAEDRIFDPFFSTKPGGMGMGLSIARSIIEAHGGRISAANGAPGGVFEFTVPIAEPDV